MTLVGTAFRDATSAAESGTKYPPPGRSGSGDPWKPEPRILVGRSPRDRRSNPRSWGIPKGPQHVRNSVSYASCETSPKKSKGTIRRLRYVGKSHVACLLIMFLQGRLAMPHMRHENVRHATLLFRAEGVMCEPR